MNPTDGMACVTSGCDNRGNPGLHIEGYGSFATKSGRRQRYRCTVCRGTLSTNTATAYRGLRCTRREFDQIARLRVEGMSISATARVTGHSCNTIARWLERASTAAKRFNHRMLRGFDLIELQADELCAFVGNKNKTVWLVATLEVPSRLWAGSVLGRRSDHNARAVINDVVRRGRVVGPDRHRWLRVLHRGGWGSLWVNVRLWPSAQDAVKQSCHPGRAPREDRYGESTAGRVVGVGAFRDPEHFVRRAPQPHDSASVGVPTSAIALPCPWRRPAPPPRRVRAVPLQLRPTAPGLAVRARNQDASHAGWSREHAIGPERHLHSAPCHSAGSCGARRNRRRRVFDALVAERTTNGGLINSERRKHRGPSGPDRETRGESCPMEDEHA